MSKKVLVSVFDKIAGLYSPVMTEINPDSAIRNFKIGAKQNQQISACRKITAWFFSELWMMKLVRLLRLIHLMVHRQFFFKQKICSC